MPAAAADVPWAAYLYVLCAVAFAVWVSRRAALVLHGMLAAWKL